MDEKIQLIQLEDKVSRSSEDLSRRLKDHVDFLALQVGERNFIRREALDRAADYVYTAFKQAGYDPKFQEFRMEGIPWLTGLRTSRHEKVILNGSIFKNVLATRKGSSDEVIVVGAHYDTVLGTPGADDNASGVAVLLEVARLLQGRELGRTIEWVAFANEEPPFFRTSAMGSAHFVESALRCGRKIIFMISLEMLGFYSEEHYSQLYPPLLRFFYPNHANFIAVTGNLSSRSFVKQIARAFKDKTNIPVESLAAPRFVPGLDFSDQLNFWKKGIPAIMLTDTAFYRNPHYHLHSDLPKTLDFEKMAEVAKGIFASLLEIGQAK